MYGLSAMPPAYTVPPMVTVPQVLVLLESLPLPMLQGESELPKAMYLNYRNGTVAEAKPEPIAKTFSIVSEESSLPQAAEEDE